MYQHISLADTANVVGGNTATVDTTNSLIGKYRAPGNSPFLKKNAACITYEEEGRWTSLIDTLYVAAGCYLFGGLL